MNELTQYLEAKDFQINNKQTSCPAIDITNTREV